MKDERVHTQIYGEILEILLYLNVSLTLIFFVFFTPFRNTGIAKTLNNMAFSINYSLHGNKYGAIGANLTLLFAAIVTSLCLLSLRMIFPERAIKAVLKWSPGIAAIVTTPLCFLLFSHFRWFGRFPVVRWDGWYLFETAVCVICALLYVLQKWPMSSLMNFMLLFAHFVYWAWHFWTFVLVSGYIAIPVTGFCTVCVWGVYLHRANSTTAAE